MTVQLAGLGLRFIMVLCIAWNTVFLCATANAQPATFFKDQNKYSHQRLIHQFDFEEARFGNFENMPGFWHRIGIPSNIGVPHFDKQLLHQQLMKLGGYPGYAKVQFNFPQYQKGDHSLHLGLNGGNAGAFLEVGAIPAVPDSDYRITARIRTEKLEHAQVKFTIYFVDGKGKRVEESLNTTGLFVSDHEWTNVSMKLHGDYRNAAWIGMQFQLLQPSYDKNSLLGEHQVLFNEVDGDAWIDDISIWQLPNIELTTQNKANIIRAPKKPELTIKVRDLSGRRLVSELTIYDYCRKQVDYKKQAVGAGAPNTWIHHPKLKKYGWYLVDLAVSETQAKDGSSINDPVARTLCSFLWLPNDRPRKLEDAQKFSVRAVNLPDDQLPMLPNLIQQSGVYGMTISPWRKDTTLKKIEAQQSQLDDILHGLLRSNCQISFSLYPLPDALMTDLQQANLMPHMLFEKDINIWSAYFKPVILRHSQRVRQWELGTASSPAAMLQNGLGELMARTRNHFEKLAPNPDLLLPWSIYEPRHPDIKPNVGYVLQVPQGVRPEYISEFLEEWEKPPAVKHAMLLEVAPATELSQKDRVTDLALRMLHGWEVTQSGMMINQPWTVTDRRNIALLPDPVLGVFSNLANRLSGRRVVKRMNLGRGIECQIFEGPAGGMLAMWDQSAQNPRKVQNMYLGGNPIWHDLWGNHLPMNVVEGKQQFTINKEPTFMENIDLELALLRASFELNDPFIESRQIPHNRIIKMHNPWNQTISGHISFIQPSKWRISPKRMFFSMAADADYEIPIQLSFPISETAGHKELVAQLEFTSQKQYKVHFATPMQIGLKDIDFYSHLTIDLNPKTGKFDAVVTQRIANRGKEIVSLYAFANMSGYSRQERLISRLHPGESIIRNFRFPGGAEKLKKQKIRTGLRETSGPSVINHMLSAFDLVTHDN